MPLVVWAVVVLAFVLISFKILSYGLVPSGDAQRHVAHALTDRSYNEIIVMNPVYTVNHSPGWEWLLKQLNRVGGISRDGLTGFSVAFCLLCVFLSPLPWLSRPEAWLAAVLAQLLAIPGFMWRLTQGRPYLITEALLLMILCMWANNTRTRPTPLRLICTAVAVALSVWIHGSWYLWILPLAAFIFAQRYRDAKWFAGCVASGVLVGSCLTGHPYVFLRQAVTIARAVAEENLHPTLLVDEFQPSNGEILTLVVLSLVFLWRKQVSTATRPLMTNLLICQFALCWMLGLYNVRFFADWAVPASMLWVAFSIEKGLLEAWPATSPKRIVTALFLACALFLHTTRETYINSDEKPGLDAAAPQLAGWFPDAGGVFYTSDFDFFYRTFYQNPDGPWRYILGMEPGLMPPEDRQIFRNIQSSKLSTAYEPWIRKMRPSDRLVLNVHDQPPLPGLEWKNAAPDYWIGRPPAKAAE